MYDLSLGHKWLWGEQKPIERREQSNQENGGSFQRHGESEE